MTMNKQNFRKNAQRAYVEQLALANVALMIADALEASGVSQRDLAGRLGLSEARVSQILNANNNLTVRTLARIADALGLELELKLRNGEERPGLVSDDENAEETGWRVFANKSYRPSVSLPSHRQYVERSLNEAA